MTKESIKKKIDIELDNNTIDGVYSNLVVINHSSSEFIFCMEGKMENPKSVMIIEGFS